MSEPELTLSDFRRYFPFTPTALCLKECARLVALRRHPQESPLLDVGCGDGLFAGIAFEGKESWGIDINEDELRLARTSKAYSRVIHGDITTEELPADHFASCVANCSLEHVPRIDLALSNIFKSLRPGGTFVTFVPKKGWAEQLLSYRILKVLGASGWANQLQSKIDNFFVHHHLHDEKGWRKLVEAAGFEIQVMEPVLSSANTAAFEMFLLPSLLGLANKKLTKRWTNFPRLRGALATPVYTLAKGALASGDSQPTAEFLIVARRPETA